MVPLALSLSVPIGLSPVAAEATGGLGRPDVPKPRVGRIHEGPGPGAKRAREQVAKELQKNTAQVLRARAEQLRLSWPKAGNADVALAAGRIKAAPGGLPVTLAPSGGKNTLRANDNATITVLDQKAADQLGIFGVVLTAEAERAGGAEVSIDYGGFASAIGGGWAGRLRLVQLPACSLSTPQKAECRTQAPLPSHNDPKNQTVTSRVALAESTDGEGINAQLGSSASGATVMALTAAGADGASPNGTGDYSATPLSASSSWSAGGSSGSFTWSYGFALPPAAAGPTPSLSLGYDSGSIDGRTATTNNQGTSIGEGFSLTESYIERSYGSCDKDGHTDVFDRCWKYDNARIVLNGKSSRLVKADATNATAATSEWKLENDDASKVTRSIGADNNDDNGEYWTVITGDGTKYVFGRNKLDGATTERTNSTWTTPVFGDDAGEPGHDAGPAFAERSVTQAWRWNLDYVEDPHDNATTYWYTPEKNYYRKNKAAKADAEYVRGGYLKEIKYGLRKGALFTDDADAKVAFGYAERCTEGACSSLTKETAETWPDVPFDAICASGSTECLPQSPSFFTRKRLTGIDTSSWNASTGTYDAVDSWDLVQEYQDGGDIGDTSDHVLTLKSITRTAKAGTTAIKTNPVVFTYDKRPNRVDDDQDHILALTRPRIRTIVSETGGITTVEMSPAECVRSQVLTAPEDTNTRSCYPQYWNINGSSIASVDWFHKYRVIGVLQSDLAGWNDPVENEYVYSGAAWHYNDDPFTPKDERTWSDWRGYREVTVYKGAVRPGVNRTKTVSLYMQGMNGDKNSNGTTKSVTIAALTQPAIGVASLPDTNQHAGTLREQVTYNGVTPIAATVNLPWSRETARQSAVPDADDHVSRFVRTQRTTSYTYLTASDSWRSRATSTLSFDGYGMPTEAVDLGDEDKSGDEVCTETWYARNVDAGLTNLVSRVRTVGLNCGYAEADLQLAAADGTRANVMADTAISYDDIAWSTTMKPVKGLPTWTGRASAYGTGGAVTWQKTSVTAYDDLGRPTTVTDAQGSTMTTAYSPVDSGPLTRTIVTNPLTHKVTSYLDPRRGLAQRTYDANLKKTELAYDAMGRLTDVWLPNRNRSTQVPNIQYRYSLNNTVESWVSTANLKADGETYNTSYAIYDSLLRPLQTQSPTPQGGRLLTDTRYNTLGMAYATYSDVFDTSAPGSKYARALYGGAPKQTETVFDGAGRPTSNALYVKGTLTWTTNTSYTGDSTATTALNGGSAARTITDALGRTVETRAYAGPSPADLQYGASLGNSYTSTKFEYTRDGKQSKISGPDGAVWKYVYDQYGRQKTTEDPDKGTTRTEYDGLDRPVKVTTGSSTVVTGYDALGRPTNTWSGTASEATLLTSRTYDTPLKGLPATSTRYVGGKTGKVYTKSVTAYDVLGRPATTELALPATDPISPSVPGGKVTYQSTYRNDGTVGSTSEPALGGLPSEVIGYGYGSLGQLTSVKGLNGYLQQADYSETGQVLQLTLGKGGTGDRNVYITNRFEEGTDRLTLSHVTDQTHPYMLQHLTYTYDQAGNVTSIADPTILGGTTKAETQCFAYDGHSRLTEAWTPTSQNCGDARNASALSGPAPYWTSYTYNTAGQRKTETQHLSTGSTTTTYCYDPAKQPHALRYTTPRTTCGTAADPTKDKVYGYDATGNTTKRPGDTAQQNLTWSPEGQLATLAESTKSTDYVYDADGILLIRNTKAGERVLYTGATELHRRDNGTTWAQRSYTANGTPIAVRTNETGTTQLQFLAGDHHGTQSLAVTSDATQKPTKRYMTPFGAKRGGAVGTWPTDKGFLNKTTDASTGLTHIGARQYDPKIGQFISVDPLLSTDQHQSLNGYSYANQHPTTTADPTGLRTDDVPSNPNRDYCYIYVCSSSDGVDAGKGGAGNGNGSGNPTHGGTHFGRTTAPTGTASSSGGGGGGNAGSSGAPESHDLSWSNPVSEAFWGVISIGAHTSSLFGWIGDSDCWNGGAGAPGCDYGATFDQWVLEQGVDSTSDWYQVPGFVGEMIAHGRAGGGAGTKPRKTTPLPGGNCFLAGTLVLMGDGSTKEIQDVEVGDEVLATDPETGETGARPVTQLIRTEETKHLNTLSIATPDGTETLTATSEHPFWSASQHSWIAAKDLKPGMALLTDNGETVAVNGNTSFIQYVKTYNFTVDDLHTYYVLAGQTPVLVHNTCLNVAQILSELANKRVTTGRLFSNSKEMHAEIEAGGNSPLVQATDAYLRQHGAPINPRVKYYPAAQHVEAQYAMVMREGRTKSATVVMNNRAGVCGDMYGCQGAVAKILPVGYTMEVWYPGAEAAKIIHGEGSAP
ncbi:polymorphic toxin-type HINT domain-containing protein [Streptomyces narbonensis]|uniref:polymorphic toxin-type HINT domain-containing protein n=1 Tax=Streptomyces narbonensis TaxID=67333 RepID=UPI001E546A94|nr:polymorphic toxin-type HINT domain-containing protein [Streptomyces narbonensis]